MSKVDPRVPAMLDLAEFEYRTDDDGDTFLPVSGWEESRHQVVFIRSRTYSYDNQEFRDVFAYAHTGDLPPAKVLAHCLKQNQQVKVGSWRLQIDPEAGKTALLFGADLDANASPQRLKHVLMNVAKTADDLERKLSEEDRL